MKPNGFDIFETAVKISPNVAYFLPRNTNVEQVRVLLINPGKVLRFI